MTEACDFVFENGSGTGVLDLRVYRLSAVKKAAYRIADRCTVMLGTPSEDRLPVKMTFKQNVTDIAARECVRTFFEELLDQELREQIAEETQPVRTLILAHAFSKTDLIRHE